MKLLMNGIQKDSVIGLEWYNQKAIQSRLFYQLFQVLIIAFSAISSVILSIESPSFKQWSIFLTISVTIMASLLNFFNFKENWLTWRTTTDLLEREESYFKCNMEPYTSSNDPRSLFIKKVEDIISAEHSTWRATTLESRSTN